MADRSSVNTNTVLLYAADIIPLIVANLKNADPNIIEIREGIGADRVAEVVIPLSKATVDILLKTLIPDLPADYKIQNLFGNQNLVARITWNS